MFFFPTAALGGGRAGGVGRCVHQSETMKKIVSLFFGLLQSSNKANLGSKSNYSKVRDFKQ